MGCDINIIIIVLETKMIESATLTVTGMKCGGCENNVTTKLKTIDGVIAVSASSKDKTVKVEFDTTKTSPKAIAKAITDVGYMVIDE
jgi:copper chaperone